MTTAEITGPVKDANKGLPRSLWIVPLILALENSAIVQIPQPWFVIYQYRGIPIVFGLALLFFGRRRLLGVGVDEITINFTYAGAHVGCLIIFAGVEMLLIRFGDAASSLQLRIGVALWLVLIASLVVTLLRTF